MKKRNNKIVLGLILVIALVYIISTGINPSADKLAKDFIKDFYQVKVDSETYQASIDLEGLKDHYGPYFTENGFDDFIMDRPMVAIERSLFLRKFKMEVLSIDLEASLKEEDHEVYNYRAELKLTYDDGQEENITESGYVNMLKVNNGWKIDKSRIGLNHFME